MAERDDGAAAGPPFVGRRPELDRLSRLVGSDERGRAAIIEGDPGIGKTVLLEALLDRARSQGYDVLVGRCYALEEAGTYFPILQVLSQLQRADEKFHDFLRRHRSRWNIAEEPSRRRSLFLHQLCNILISSVGDRNTILALEDIHWADTGSLLVLNTLLDLRAEKLRLVCTVRPDEVSDVTRRQLIVAVEQRSRRVILHGLSLEEGRELLKELTPTGLLRPREERDLWSYTAGNPMFLTELVRHLLEVGLLTQGSALEAIERSGTPRSLASVIELWLERCPPTVRETLAAAAVVGTEFSVALLAAVRHKREEEVREILSIAQVLQLVRPTHALGERFMFRHPLIASSLYDGLPFRLRADLHHRVAVHGETVTPCLSEEALVRHYALGLRSKTHSLTAHRCRRAAELAEAVAGYESAGQLWELALRCTRPSASRIRAELYRRLGWARWAAGSWQAAQEAWEAAEQLLESSGQSGRAAEVALALGNLHRWRAEDEDAQRWLERALRLGLRRRSDRAYALALLGGIVSVRDETAGIKLLEEAAALATQGRADPRVSFWLSYGLLCAGEWEQAFEAGQIGLVAALAQDDEQATGLLAGTLFTHELGKMHLAAARQHLKIVHDTASPSDPPSLIRLLRCQAFLRGYQGRWHHVVRLCERWVAEVRLAGRYQLATARFLWGEAQSALGNFEAARSEMERALPDLADLQGVADAHLARVYLRAGDPSAALTFARSGQHVLDSSRRASTAAGIAVLGEVAAALGDLALMDWSYDRLKREEREIVIAYSPVSVGRVLALLETRAGSWGNAIDSFEDTLTKLRAGGALGELAQAYLGYAQMRRLRRRRGDARKAAAFDAEADALLRRLGLDHVGQAPTTVFQGDRFGLTGRELEVLALVATGRRDGEIAEALTISPRTVGRHLESILMKMDVANRTQAVVKAFSEGLLGLPAIDPQI